MKAYKGEYDNDIEVELEQDNIEQNFDNEQEKDKIIPNNENEGFTSKKYNKNLLKLKAEKEV
ncbi:hypothetical protein C1645_823849 [Glomus cerebriforme]|uniref:Uncharacterized protein n=1 Tax=Glomus cerebriforme TaxID=658196 RepID=A0A397SVN4_9GLOM|nr:hypothetical protein C1645_823849 [Glomus cerebriforme]